MLRIKAEFINQIDIEKSKFITYVNRCTSEDEAKEYILSIKKLHPKATHHTYAFVVGPNHELQRSNDDGEPSGTAGAPMLEALRLSNIHDCVCVCVRYFGGIKLGAGGLVRAYSTSVSTALQKALKTKLVPVLEYEMHFAYDLIGRFDYLLQNKNAIFLNKEYDENVYYHFYTYDDSFLKDIQELSSNSVIPTFIQKQIIEQDID